MVTAPLHLGKVDKENSMFYWEGLSYDVVLLFCFISL